MPEDPGLASNNGDNKASRNVAAQKRGPWSSEEDRKLMDLITLYGPTNWVRIATFLGSRTAKQCRERYHQNLKPSLNRSPISPEEGALIEELVQRHGKRWAEIARHLNGRSDNAIKNWWNGGANRRRRASTQADTHLLRQEPQDVKSSSPHQLSSNTQQQPAPSSTTINSQLQPAPHFGKSQIVLPSFNSGFSTSPTTHESEYNKRRVLDRRHSAATILSSSYLSPSPNSITTSRNSSISFDAYSSAESISTSRRSSIIDNVAFDTSRKRNSVYMFNSATNNKEQLPSISYQNQNSITLPPLNNTANDGIFKTNFSMVKQKPSYENMKYSNSPIFKTNFSFSNKSNNKNDSSVILNPPKETDGDSVTPSKNDVIMTDIEMRRETSYDNRGNSSNEELSHTPETTIKEDMKDNFDKQYSNDSKNDDKDDGNSSNDGRLKIANLLS